MARALQVGDIVQLKSGGPEMTVRSIEVKGPNTTVYCVWYCHPKSEYQDKSFQDPEILKLVENSTES